MPTELKGRPEDWFHDQLRETVERLLKRPPSRRGPFVIPDSHLRAALRAIQDSRP